jgi:hypothetical protein
MIGLSYAWSLAIYKMWFKFIIGLRLIRAKTGIRGFKTATLRVAAAPGGCGWITHSADGTAYAAGFIRQQDDDHRLAAAEYQRHRAPQPVDCFQGVFAGRIPITCLPKQINQPNFG